MIEKEKIVELQDDGLSVRTDFHSVCVPLQVWEATVEIDSRPNPFKSVPTQLQNDQVFGHWLNQSLYLYLIESNSAPPSAKDQVSAYVDIISNDPRASLGSVQRDEVNCTVGFLNCFLQDPQVCCGTQKDWYIGGILRQLLPSLNEQFILSLSNREAPFYHSLILQPLVDVVRQVSLFPPVGRQKLTGPVPSPWMQFRQREKVFE